MPFGSPVISLFAFASPGEANLWRESADFKLVARARVACFFARRLMNRKCTLEEIFWIWREKGERDVRFIGSTWDWRDVYCFPSFSFARLRDERFEISDWVMALEEDLDCACMLLMHRSCCRCKDVIRRFKSWVTKKFSKYFLAKYWTSAQQYFNVSVLVLCFMGSLTVIKN